MAVGIKVKFYWYQVGSGDLLHAFFSNVCYHLEKGNWGSIYPHIMKMLYQGLLPHYALKNAINELEQIKNNFEKLSVDKVIWDIENLNITPPWKENISPEITSLSNYFITSDDDNLILHMIDALKKADQLGCDAKIESL